VRGFDKVRGEWSLMALCYNFTRLLSILGFDRVMEHMTKLTQRLARLLRFVCRSTASLGPIRLDLAHFCAQTAPKPEVCGLTA
jgi:hypothetical protein